MADRRKRALRVQFDGKFRLEFHGAKITSDAGLLAFRELDEAFSFDGERRCRVVRSAPWREHASHDVGHVATGDLWTVGWI